MEMIQHKFRHSNPPIIESVRSSAYLYESYRTLRDGCFGWRRPRHFVPGYDQPVPPEHFAMGSGRKSLNVTFRKCPNSSPGISCLATISLSLWDKSHSP
jgi:hypothetical protein